MRSWTAERVASIAGARVVRGAASDGGPTRAVIASSSVLPGDLFVGLPGERTDGGRFAGEALTAGAWGVLVGPAFAGVQGPGAVLVAEDPLQAMQRLATAWRRELGASVVGITGSTGKTSTKDLLLAMLAPQRRTVGTRQNLNTEIGLPLTILEAPADTEVLVLEMAMRGPGQIAELARIAEPDVGVVTNVGPVHLELLGSLTAIAAAKGELLDALGPGATAVVPREDQGLPDPPPGVDVVTFGPDDPLGPLGRDLGSAHMRLNAAAALAAARAIGVEPSGTLELALSARRGQRTRVGEVTVVDDCYNANPMSMRAALDDLSASAPGRRVAVLGDMLELGPDAEAFHAEIGAHARAAGVELLVTVGPLAAAMGGERAVADAAQAAALVPGLLQDGDTVLVKASRGVGLEAVVEALGA